MRNRNRISLNQMNYLVSNITLGISEWKMSLAAAKALAAQWESEGYEVIIY